MAKLPLGRLIAFTCLFLGQVSASVNFNVQDPNTLSFNAGQNNQVRRFANVQLVKTTSDYTVFVDAGVRNTRVQRVITNNQLADLDVTIKSKNITATKLKEDKSFEIDLEITSVPNPQPSGGYIVYLQAQATQFNLINESKDFFKFQTNASSNDQTQLLYFDILEKDGKTMVASWFTTQESTLLTTDWSNYRLIEVDNSQGSRKTEKRTFALKFEYDFLKDLPTGTYLFRILMGMNPFVKPTLAVEIAEYEAYVDEQASFFDNLLGEMQGNLRNLNFVVRLTSEQLTQIKKNELKLLDDYEQFLKDVKKTYETLLKRSGLTIQEITDLNRRIDRVESRLEEVLQIKDGIDV